MMVSEYLETVKARLKRIYRLPPRGLERTPCDVLQEIDEAVDDWDAHVRSDIETLVKMMEILWGDTPIGRLAKRIETLVPEEKVRTA